ncbi:MAG: nucleotidyltransferase domain-containing protein [Defluviitaleaceae bacterium]|nr:nucleotidyltransferase domain-containing protein [Defluviitaleaceae bacterium]
MLDKSTVREIANNYAQVIRQTYTPKQVILFGSYVNGTPRADSDIDIAVVFEHVEGDFLEQWGRLIRLCENVSYDIEPHMLDESSNSSGFLDHIRSTGEVIFEA